MNIILFTKYIGSPLTLRMGHSRFYVISLSLILIICAGLFYAGFWLGQARTLQYTDGGIFTTEKQRIAALQKKLRSSRRSAQTYLAALSLQLGIMKSHVIRLDALGQRLTRMANLDSGEFNFSKPPAQGGPAGAEIGQVKIKDFLKEMSDLSLLLQDREVNLSVLETQIMHIRLEQKVVPKGRPVKKGYPSSSYGSRRDPFTGRKTFHDGIDYAAKKGTPIYSVADGVVTSSGKRAGYGNLVEVNHGEYITRYAHNHKNLVKVGQKVTQGQQIAQMGSTGRSTGPHVHFEIVNKKGKPVNPYPFIKNKHVIR